MLFELLSKHYPGMRQWLTQRLSAMVLAGYCILLILLLWLHQPADYQQWTAFFEPIWWRMLTFIFFANLLMHAWLGIGNVMKDYVFNIPLRLVLLGLVEVLAILQLIWIAYILWHV